MTKKQIARQYRRWGYTYADIAKVMNVSRSWAFALCNDHDWERRMERSAAWIASGVCPDCGGRMTQPTMGDHPSRGAYQKPYERCAPCHRKRVSDAAFQRHVIGKTLLCRTCHERKPFDAYPQGLLSKYLRREIIASNPPQCRTCDSAARKAYRERTKVPCVGCGKPALPASEKGARGFAEPRCRECYYATLAA